MDLGKAKPRSAARDLICWISAYIRHNRLLIDVDHDSGNMTTDEVPATGLMTGMRDDGGKTGGPSDGHE